jgi:hypothetical protein
MAIPDYNVAPFITQPLATHAVSVNPFDVASFYGTLTLSPAVDIWKDVDTQPAQVVDLGGPSQTWTKGQSAVVHELGRMGPDVERRDCVTPRNQYFTPPGWTPGITTSAR